MTNKITKYIVNGMTSLALASTLAGCSPDEQYATHGWMELDNGEKVRTTWHAFRGNYTSLEVERIDGTKITYRDDASADNWKEGYLEKTKLREVEVESKTSDATYSIYCPAYTQAISIAQTQYTNYLARIQLEKTRRSLEAITGERK